MVQSFVCAHDQSLADECQLTAAAPVIEAAHFVGAWGSPHSTPT